MSLLYVPMRFTVVLRVYGNWYMTCRENQKKIRRIRKGEKSKIKLHPAVIELVPIDSQKEKKTLISDYQIIIIV